MENRTNPHVYVVHPNSPPPELAGIPVEWRDNNACGDEDCCGPIIWSAQITPEQWDARTPEMALDESLNDDPYWIALEESGNY